MDGEAVGPGLLRSINIGLTLPGRLWFMRFGMGWAETGPNANCHLNRVNFKSKQRELTMGYVTEERLIELLGAMECRIKKNADEAHSEIGERIDGLSSRVDGLDTKVDGLSSRVDGLDTKVDGLSSRVDGLDTKVDGLRNL